ncbi:hypothetical protein TIFTF001_046747 [Ficus carica]|uniref:Uncharacterized protein n=1 Tax=Ficus carica TaxID=3494 RepID=A0AA88CVT8_FICCA|nr:hypothetical protein TIFTF001_046735 [Ficus carica]GMN33827.1 hypothetical protein TIFTF001_046739 [Ficus carica]GMN33851.1 hypothetical protein TIFTF001_046743 [Ficus carica]GMN33875.1 hypothetical protein TIFTF001_046747 [Ficus carica]
MEWRRPICASVRTGASLPLRKPVQALTVIAFLAIAFFILSAMGRRFSLSKTVVTRATVISRPYSTSAIQIPTLVVNQPHSIGFFLRMATPSSTNLQGAEKLSLPYLSAYLDSIGTNFRHGANFATGGSTIQPVDTKIFGAGFSPISLQIQLLQFKQFKARTEELFKEGQLQTSSNVKTSLPRPEDFSKALYSFDIGQNDLHAGLKTMTEDQLKASFPNIISMLAQAAKVTER